MKSARAIAAFVAVLAALALLPAAALAEPVGLIEELPVPAHVGTIATGGEGHLWFTDVRRPAAIGWVRPQQKPKIHRFRLPQGVTPEHLVIGREHSAWFTYSLGGIKSLGTAGGGVGRVTPGGQVTLFPEPPNPAGAPFEIVLGPDGNLWFDHAGAFLTPGGALGRITPAGEVTAYSAGLQPGAVVTNLEPGVPIEDGLPGSVWFADNSAQPAIGRISPAGVITEFGGLPPQQQPAVEGPSSAGGNLFFAANESPQPAVERITPSGEISRFSEGLAPDVTGLGPFLGVFTGDAWFRIQRRSGPGTSASPDGPVAIGHVSRSGKIEEYSSCLRPVQSYNSVRELMHGPDGNVWFTTWPSGSPRHFKRLTTPSLGSITRGGRITELRYGLHPQSEPEDLTSVGGFIWFLDRRNHRLGRVDPPEGVAANTFQLLRLLRGKSARPAVELDVPGPGRLSLRELGHRLGLASSTATAPACGPATIAVPMRPPLVQALHRHGVVFIDAVITFKPRGGPPFGEKLQIEVGVAGE